MTRSWGGLYFGLLPAIAACGGGDGFGEFAGRLGPIGFSDGRGAVRIDYLRDRTLNVDCVVREDETGQLRCLPRHVVYPYEVGDDCAEPVITFRGEERPRFVTVLTDLGAVPHEIGEAYEGPAGDCIAPGGGLAPEPPLFRIARSEARLFAEVTAERTQVAPDLDRITHVADDGSRGFGELQDRRWGRSCRPQGLGGALYCGPSAYGQLSGYLDAQCASESVALSFSSLDRQPVHVWAAPQICALPTLYEVDPWPDGATLYADTLTSTSCEAREPPAQLVTTRARAVDPALVLPSLSEVEEGEGRLVARQIAHEGRVLERASTEFFDRELGVGCSPRHTEDGVVCFPTHLAIEMDVYRDAECTQPIRIVPRYDGHDVRFATDGDDDLYRVTDEVVEEVFIAVLDNCGGITFSSPCSHWSVVGEKVDVELAEMSFGPIAPIED
ncbi:MAG: hypothetical protein RIT81_45545 [Deltaproteobacteria bacterium]